MYDIFLVDCLVTAIISRLHFKQDDLFSYFEALASQELLPCITDLEAAAIQLHRTYSSTTGLHRALRDMSSPTDWSKQVPVGTPISNIVPAIDGGNGAEQFKGDLILA